MDFDTFWRRMRQSRTAADRGLVICRQIPSSHELARRAAREYSAEGNLAPASDFLAWHQTAGRGRYERRWASPAGAGVYVSMVRRLRREQIQALPMTVSSALATALREQAGVPCRVKWPNDLIVGNRKLGGILIDVVTSGDVDPIAVVSFGVNHGQISAFGEACAVSVSEQGSSLALDELATILMNRVDDDLRRVSNVSEVVTTYRGLSIHCLGDELECQLEGGSKDRTRGIFLGIDDQGLLRLEVAGKERRLSAGRLIG